MKGKNMMAIIYFICSLLFVNISFGQINKKNANNIIGNDILIDVNYNIESHTEIFLKGIKYKSFYNFASCSLRDGYGIQFSNSILNYCRS